MTDVTATDRAPMTDAHRDAADILEALRAVSASVSMLCSDYDATLFRTALDADTPGRYALYLTGQLTARLDALRAAASSALLYAGTYAEIAARGELDTATDRGARMARTAPTLPGWSEAVADVTGDASIDPDPADAGAQPVPTPVGELVDLGDGPREVLPRCGQNPAGDLLCTTHGFAYGDDRGLESHIEACGGDCRVASVCPEHGVETL